MQFGAKIFLKKHSVCLNQISINILNKKNKKQTHKFDSSIQNEYSTVELQVPKPKNVQINLKISVEIFWSKLMVDFLLKIFYYYIIISLPRFVNLFNLFYSDVFTQLSMYNSVFPEILTLLFIMIDISNDIVSLNKFTNMIIIHWRN